MRFASDMAPEVKDSDPFAAFNRSSGICLENGRFLGIESLPVVGRTWPGKHIR
jgi:hypothetical protein